MEYSYIALNNNRSPKPLINLKDVSMKIRIFAICLAMVIALGSVMAQTKSDTKAKSADTKKAACCMKDAKGPHATAATKADCDTSQCTKMSAKGGPKMDCCKDKAKGGPKMDCSKDNAKSGAKMDCCKDKAKDAAEKDSKDKDTK